MSVSEKTGKKHSWPRIHKVKENNMFPIAKYQLKDNPENLSALWKN